MVSIRLIKRRIRSAKNISKITYAMEMVAASKMKKAQEQALAGKPYAQKIYEAVSDLAEKIDPKLHPLLKREKEGQEIPKILLVVISTNKGLCGGLNTNLFRFLIRFEEQTKGRFGYITLGKKGTGFILSRKEEILADFSEGKFLENTTAVISLICSLYRQGRYGEVWLIYNDFHSVLKIKPASFRILPIGSIEKKKSDDTAGGFLIEPSADEVLENLLPHFLEVELRSAILASEASEHSSRMLAMKNATENALGLVSQLTLDYNKARQQNITSEIADIVTAKMSI